MRFSRNEMVAIMKLALDMAAADGKMDEKETKLIALHSASFGLNETNFESIFTEAISIKSGLAMSVVSNMSSSQKRYVTAYLGSMIAVDGDIDDAEMKLWSLISALCDLPTMSVREALEIMANE
jgi:uncharacterized tellurite resistance protein B-like protein